MANNTLALDLDLFDTAKNGYAPAMPEHREVKIPKLKVMKEKPVSAGEYRREANASRVASIRACAIALMTLLVIGSLIFCRVLITNLNIELNQMKTELSASQSENTALQMEYDGMLSTDRVESIAKDKLGMVKAEKYQVKYFDMSGSDGAQPIQ